LLAQIPPKAYGYSRTRESAPSRTGALFDPVTLAEVAAGHSLEALLHHERLARLALQSSLDPAQLSPAALFARLQEAVLLEEYAGLEGAIDRRRGELLLQHWRPVRQSAGGARRARRSPDALDNAARLMRSRHRSPAAYKSFYSYQLWLIEQTFEDGMQLRRNPSPRLCPRDRLSAAADDPDSRGQPPGGDGGAFRHQRRRRFSSSARAGARSSAVRLSPSSARFWHRTSGLLPHAAPAYDFVFSYFVPVLIPLFLFQADLRRILFESTRLTLAFLVASAATVAGVTVAALTLDLSALAPAAELAAGDREPAIAGLFASTYIGGSVNYAALGETTGLNADASFFSAATAADNLFSAVYLAFLALIPGWQWLARKFPAHEAREAIEETGTAAVTAASLCLALATSLVIVAGRMRCWRGWISRPGAMC
jgi:hypothetical protein